MLEIKKFKDPILRKKCLEVKLTDEVRSLINEMKETMYAANGVGLAAPQIGRSERIAVIDIGEGFLALVNPKIIKKEGSAIFEEGCLSFPGIFRKIKRAKKVKVTALNEEGENIEIETSGFLACCLQHEIDHLDGIIFLDRLSQLDKIKDKFKKCLKKY